MMVFEIEREVEPQQQDIDDYERQRRRQPIPDVGEQPVLARLVGLRPVVTGSVARGPVILGPVALLSFDGSLCLLRIAIQDGPP